MSIPYPLHVAVNRFGLGLKAGERWRPGEARDRVEAQLRTKDPAAPAALPDTQENLRRMVERRLAAREMRNAAGQGGAKPDQAMAGQGMPGEPGPMAPASRPAPAAAPSHPTRGEELAARLSQVVTTPAPLVERLVLHWYNHFTVAAGKGKVGVTIGPYEREAIRPRVLGSFHDLLVAAVTHPAMIFYLDNDTSIGPNSVAGRRDGKGLNENLAREILELHTLGVGGGYAQRDITAFAAILSGWTVALKSDNPDFGNTVFVPTRHEPGPQTLLGKVYPDEGERQLLAALRDLARHPSTAHNVAVRLARSFVSERPPPRLVQQLAETFRRTDGDLRALALTLVRSDEAWSAPLVKLRQPIEFLYATARFLGQAPPGPAAALSAMGQPYLHAPSPKGWPDEDGAWATSDGIKTRLDWVGEVAQHHAAGLDMKAVVDDLYRPLVSDETRTAVLRAESQRQALTLFLMSPDFQRR